MKERGVVLNHQFIRWRREQLGLSVKHCASVVGVSPPAWSQWESGVRGANKSLLPGIAGALAIEIENIGLLRADTLESIEHEAERARDRRNELARKNGRAA